MSWLERCLDFIAVWVKLIRKRFNFLRETFKTFMEDNKLNLHWNHSLVDFITSIVYSLSLSLSVLQRPVADRTSSISS